jgi:hypothetical protein
MGIIDEKRLRASISRTMTHGEQNPLDTTVSVELWLRALSERKGRRHLWT